MNRELNILTLKCLRCGHEWIPNRPIEPKVCPKCNSPYWNKVKWKQSGPQRKSQSGTELCDDDACSSDDADNL